MRFLVSKYLSLMAIATNPTMARQSDVAAAVARAAKGAKGSRVQEPETFWPKSAPEGGTGAPKGERGRSTMGKPGTRALRRGRKG